MYMCHVVTIIIRYPRVEANSNAHSIIKKEIVTSIATNRVKSNINRPFPVSGR